MRYSRPRICLAAAFPLLVVLLCSCASVDARLTIAQSGSCSLKLHYAVSEMAMALDATSGGRALLPFPISRDSYESALADLSGARLAAYSSSETDRDYIVDAELSFPDIESLAHFVNSQGPERIAYSTDNSQRTLRVVLSSGADPAKPGAAGAAAAALPGTAGTAAAQTGTAASAPAAPTQTAANAIDPDLGRYIDAAFAPYTIAISVSLPSRAASARGAALSDNGREARYSSPVAPVARSIEPVYFELVW